MSSTFTHLQDVFNAYGLSYQAVKFFDALSLTPLPANEWFKAEIEFALLNRGQDDEEAFVSEFIIVPFLKEIWKKHPKLSLFSRPTLSTLDTTVIPDYLLTARHPSGYKSMYKPLLLTVEAQNEKFDEGWIQALQQAVVCQKLNENVKIPIYAIVTTGEVWEFGKLEQQLFTYHPLPLSVQDIERLLAVLDWLYQQSEVACNIQN